MANPSVVGTATAGFSSGSTLSVPKPSGATTGMGMYAWLSYDSNGSITVSDYGGWTHVSTLQHTSPDFRVALLVKTVGASEPSTTTVTFSTSTWRTVAVALVQDMAPALYSATATDLGDDDTVNIGPVAVPAGALLLCGVGSYDGRTLAETGFSQIAHLGNLDAVALAGAGADGAYSFTGLLNSASAYGAHLVVVAPATGGLAKAETLTDNFDDNSLNTGLWTAYSDTGTSLAEASNRLELTLRASGTGYVGVFSGAQYDLTGSSVAVQCVNVGFGGTGRTASLEVELDASNQLKVMVDGASIMAQTVIGGTNTSFGTVTHAYTTHQWWRIREAGGTVYFETSRTGYPGTWTALYSRANPFALTAVRLRLFGGCYASIASPGVVRFDNLNLLYAPQYVAPTSDVSVTSPGTWTTDTGGTANFYATLDEAEPGDDADYMQSVAIPYQADYVQVGLPAVADPLVDGGHAVSYRAWLSDATTAPMFLDLQLRQGGTIKANAGTTALTTTPTRYDYQLTPAEGASLTNYGDLRINIGANQSNPPYPAYQAQGSYASGTGGGVGVAWPAHAVNDIALLIVEKPDSGVLTTLTTPAGFVAVPGGAYYVGGPSPNGTAINLFWCRATSTTMAAPAISGATDHNGAIIITFRGCITTGDPWDVIAGAVKATASTTSVFPEVTTTVGGCVIVNIAARDNDLSTGVFSSPSNPQLGAPTVRYDGGTTAGNGGGIGLWTGNKGNRPGLSGATTVSQTSGITAMVTMALKPPPYAPSRIRLSWVQFTVPAFRNLTGAAAGVASAAAPVTARRPLLGAAAGASASSAPLTARRRLAGGAGGLTTVAVALSSIPRLTRDLTGAAAGRGVIGVPFLWGGGGVYGEEEWGDSGVTVITGGPPPFVTVVWVGDHFELGAVGTLVLWGDDQFRLTEPGAQVTWEEDTFKVETP